MSEWFDHRLHLSDPERYWTDCWTASADNVIRVLPLGGTLLDLCSGDGFYDYWFYRKRAHVTCVEYNKEAYTHAVEHHSHPSIQYVFADVLTYEPIPASFDVVLIRGAIEHFSEENQQHLFKKSLKALKPGGYFCGDTPANATDNKLLAAHEYEWCDENEMKQALRPTFSEIETWTVESATTTNLFWRCRK